MISSDGVSARAEDGDFPSAVIRLGLVFIDV